MRNLVVISLIFLTGCAPIIISPIVHRNTEPRYKLNPKPELILILNTYDLKSQTFRKNKKELFRQLIDSVFLACKTEIEKRESVNTKIISGFTNITPSNHDSIYLLMDSYKATHAIVITSLNVEFDMTDIDREPYLDGSKRKNGLYDIVSTIGLSFYSGRSLLVDSTMIKSTYHSTRQLQSALLAFGPNVVSQQKHAWIITRSNLDDYLNLFFSNKAQ